MRGPRIREDHGMLARVGLRRLARGKAFYGVLAALVAVGLLAFSAGAPLTFDAVRRAAAAMPPAGGPVDVALALPSSFVRTVFLAPPGSVNGPPPQRQDFVCTFGEETRAEILRRPGVRGAEPGRLAAVTSSVGRVEVLSLLPGSAMLAGGVDAPGGGVPPGPGDVLVPEAWAPALGVDPGDSLALGYISPERAEHVSATFRVAGLFRPRSPFFDRLITRLDEDLFTCPAGYDVTGELDRALPNLWLVDLADRVAPSGLLFWAGQSGYSEGRLYFPEPRLPVRWAWTADGGARAVAAAAGWVFLPAGNLLGTLGAFVGAGLFALLLGDLVDRRRELATLKTLGFDAPRVARLIALEVALVGAAGLVLAGALGVPVFRALAPLYPGGALPSALAAVRAVVTVAALLGAAALFPIALAQAATVHDLLYNRPIRLWRERVEFVRAHRLK